MKALLFATLVALAAVGCSKPSEEELAYEASKQKVLRYLKAPSAAEFPEFARISESVMVLKVPDLGVFNVSAHVDAPNAFGAPLRSQWNAIAEVTSSGVHIHHLTLGGKDVFDSGWYDRPEVISELGLE